MSSVYPSPARLLPALFAAAVLACTMEPSIAPLPDGALQFAPDSLYSRYWRQIETCAQRTGDLEAIVWYKVPGLDPFPAPGVDSLVVGYWYPLDNRIVLLEYLPYPPAVIRHEMLHALLHRTDHPPLYFETRCRAIIDGPP